MPLFRPNGDLREPEPERDATEATRAEGEPVSQTDSKPSRDPKTEDSDPSALSHARGQVA